VTNLATGDRFISRPIETDRYLLACSRYVELNPVRANLVKLPEDYRWSGYRFKIGLEPCEWLDIDPCFARLATEADQRREKYRRFIGAVVPEHETSLIRGAVQRNQLTGSELFISEIEHRIGCRTLNRRRGRPGRDG
jgi:putative transposase